MTRGAQFTWTNVRRDNSLIEKRLDRTICNDASLNLWTSISRCTLIRIGSDHYPLLLEMKKDSGPHSSFFKFMKMWASHPNCIKLVQDVWKENMVGCPMFVLSQKLKMLKFKLKC